MRYLLTMVGVALATQLAQAGDPVATAREKLQENEAALHQHEINALKSLGAKTFQSVGEEIRNVDMRKFELELELARTNARREAVLARTKDQAARNGVEHDIIQRKLKALQDKRLQLQDRIANEERDLPSSNSARPGLVTDLKLELGSIDETIQFAMPKADTHFIDMLANIEVELAGIGAVQRALEARGEMLASLFERAIEIEQQRISLVNLHAELTRQLAEAEAQVAAETEQH